MSQETRTAAQRNVLSGRSSAKFRLVVIEGPDAGTSLSVPAKGSRVLLGTSVACDLRLKDPSISRRHATLEPTGPRLDYVDLGSTNGTYANEVAVVQAQLWGGERLRLGDTTMLVEVDEGFVEAPMSDATSFGRVLGRSVEMRQLYPAFERVAQSIEPLVIEGETGTGKELLAESLHEQGPVRSGRFVVLDARAPVNLAELWALASGGTLLVDDVGELDAPEQKALAALLERGGDVRVIATTQVDLDQRVHAGTFREDLFHRLFVLRVELPPLRRRAGDVAMLARHFAGQTGLDDAVVQRLERHSFPGNVRELKNVVARHLAGVEVPRAAARAAGADPIAHVLALDLALPQARELVVADFERRYVERILEQHGGNVTRAAAASGLARRYFQHIRTKRATPK